MKRALVRLFVSLAVLMAGLAALPVAAAGDPVSDFAAANTPILMVIAVVALASAFFVKGLGKRNRSALGVVGILASAMLILAFMGQGVIPTPGDGRDVAPIAWTTRMDTTFPAAADITAEMLDTQGFTACDGGTPDLNGVIATWNTNAFISQPQKLFTFQSDSDDDVTRSTVAFQEIDCPVVNVDISLSQARDVNGDGVNDLVTYMGKLMSIGPVTFSDGNQSAQNVIFFDPDAGWECAWYTEGAEWVSAFGAQRFASAMPTSGPWVPIGTHGGGGAASEDIVFACVFDTTVGAPAGYTMPNVGDIAWTATIAVGSPEDPHIHTLNWYLQTRT